MQSTHLNLLKVVAACWALSLGDRALASGRQFLPVPVIGSTRKNIFATRVIWNFASGYYL